MPSDRRHSGRCSIDLREDATRRINDFVSGKTDIGPLARWIKDNTRRVNAGGDATTRELVGKARLTIDAFLHGRVTHQGARDHLARQLAPERSDD